jgi:pimeloyl-ACP methyl ester carboxylesterase
MAFGPPIVVVSNLILAGHGPTVLFLPGSYSTPAAWRAAGGGPVHLVGHSFGGTVALAAALAGGFGIASLTLFEANPLAVLLMRGEFANAAMVALTALLDSKLPRARTEVVAGAGLFIASSHPIE